MQEIIIEKLEYYRILDKAHIQNTSEVIVEFNFYFHIENILTKSANVRVLIFRFHMSNDLEELYNRRISFLHSFEFKNLKI